VAATCLPGPLVGLVPAFDQPIEVAGEFDPAVRSSARRGALRSIDSALAVAGRPSHEPPGDRALSLTRPTDGPVIDFRRPSVPSVAYATRDRARSESTVLQTGGTVAIAHIHACAAWARYYCFGSRGCSGLAIPLPVGHPGCCLDRRRERALLCLPAGVEGLSWISPSRRW
jgi:hypothetical protein